MFYDPDDFPFTRALERHWRDIYAEYRGIEESLVDWHETRLYEGGGWKVFALFGFPDGAPVAGNIHRCPVTVDLVRTHVEGHGVAGFSTLRPMTRVRPHQGYQGDFLRCHLGLVAPRGDCGLTVAGSTRRWEAGRTLVFDDRVLHDAWNLTEEDRIVLLVDFVPRAGLAPSPPRDG